MAEPTAGELAIARAALAEITPPSTVGEPIGSLSEDGVLTVYFATTQLGYPGWRWTVSIATVDGEEPSVLETELTPGDGALLSPDWVPWADRLADYRAAQDGTEDDSGSGDDEADDEDDDDEDDLGSDVLHGGDLDGVDIDDLDDHISDDDELDADGEPDDGEPDDESAAPAGEPRSASAALDLGVDEADDAEQDADAAAPEPPDAAGVGERSDEEQQDDEADDPER